MKLLNAMSQLAKLVSITKSLPDGTRKKFLLGYETAIS
jgi:hypothetical protein